jgi:hypothetical protein
MLLPYGSPSQLRLGKNQAPKNFDARILIFSLIYVNGRICPIYGLRGLTGRDFVVVEQDPVGRTFHILELAAFHRPKKHPGNNSDEGEAQGDQ